MTISHLKKLLQRTFHIQNMNKYGAFNLLLSSEHWKKGNDKKLQRKMQFIGASKALWNCDIMEIFWS